jgi:hypothetical protein
LIGTCAQRAIPGSDRSTDSLVSDGLKVCSLVEFNEVIKRRRMVHAFTAEPLAPGTADRLLRVLHHLSG